VATALVSAWLEVIMPDILHDLPIKAARERVFQAVSTCEGLDCWWTKRSSGNPCERAIVLKASLYKIQPLVSH
jgi:hypothetical protein